MTYHIFREENVTPVTKTINIRNVIDSSSPHLVSFGNRTTVKDTFATGQHGMMYTYEDSTGGIQQIELTDIVLQQIGAINGAVWYHDQFLSVDKYYPLGDGPYAENPLGICKLDLTLTGTAGSAKITYEMIFQTFDGSPAIVFHP